jgi:hypothetical protein
MTCFEDYENIENFVSSDSCICFSFNSYSDFYFLFAHSSYVPPLLYTPCILKDAFTHLMIFA